MDHGTAGGTFAVVPDLDVAGGSLSRLVNAAGTTYFVMRKRDETTAKLWKSDGTMDGTVAIGELPLGTSVEIEAAGRRVFFNNSTALWTSDGTAQGTVEVLKGYFPYTSLGDNFLQAIGSRVLFFYRPDPNTGPIELWTSDGTPAGTKALHKSIAARPVVVDGLGYFGATDDEHGTEIWTTDGTVEGTKLGIDLNPGPAGSGPTSFARVGDLLYISAYAEGVGHELWALPLTGGRLTVRDARAAESASAVRFTVSLVSALTEPVTVDYNTSDGTARAGQDYEAASGKLTFSPGETSKTIDVRLLGDASPENNETFHLALHDANGARLLASEAAGIVVDDDQLADLSAALTFGADDLTPIITVANQGPRGATDIEITHTSVPDPDSGSTCYSCSIPQLATGASEKAYGNSSYTSGQTYRSVIVKARQGDPNPANNAVSWTRNNFRTMAMNAAYLTPGATATVFVDTEYFTPDPVSTDPSVLAISSPIAIGENFLGTFTVTALKAGTSSVSVHPDRAPLLVQVVAAGTTPRWPDALQFQTDFTAINAHKPLTLTVTPTGRAPLTGATATGTVSMTANGQLLGRRTIAGTDSMTMPLYFRTLGSVAYQIAYSGDANFLPQTRDSSVFVYRGTAGITGHLERVAGPAGSYAVKVQVTTAPGSAPTGVVRFFHDGVFKGEAVLTPSPGATSTAETTLTNLPSSPTLTAEFPGDALFSPASQQIRLAEPRRRNVRH